MSELLGYLYTLYSTASTLGHALAHSGNGQVNVEQTVFSFNNVVLHIVPAAFAAGGAWFGARMELRQMRKDLNKTTHVANVAARKLTEMAAEHKLHHGSEIDLSGFDDETGG